MCESLIIIYHIVTLNRILKYLETYCKVLKFDIHSFRILSPIGNYVVPLPGSEQISYEAVAKFSRGTSAGYLIVSSVPPSFVPGQDLFPPNRIQDLQVRSTSVQNLTIVLTWTAPGDDLDSGTGKDKKSYYNTFLLFVSSLIQKLTVNEKQQ